MLIICSGPDSFRARLKYRELVLAYKQKYDEKGTTIEQLEGDNLYETLLSKLANQSLFASKKLVLCSGLFQKLTAKQASNLREAVFRDGDISVVIDFEEKPPKETALKSFQEKELFVYTHEMARGTELNKIVADLCKRYKVDQRLAVPLIQKYQSDLWAIDTALQVLSVFEQADLGEKGFTAMDNLFAVVDMVLSGDNKWLRHANNFEPQSILSAILSQMRTWHMVQEGLAQGAHPFVQKKLSSLKIADADNKLLNQLRAFFASRQSLASGDEVISLMV